MISLAAVPPPRRRALALAGLAAALGLGACAGAPTHFYTLLPPSAADTRPAQDPAFQIAVDAVEVPAQVDVPQIVVREGNGRLVPVQTRRWIAPLGSEVRAALVAALTKKLGVADVGGVAADARLPLYRVQLSLRRFDSALGAAAQIEAVWTVHSTRDAKLTATCDSRLAVPVAPGYEALAEGHQRALIQLADAIAQALLALQAGHVTSACAGAS
ncbi:MAG: hypothetical protein NVS9B10_19900 [Nevskia sp.]